MGILVLWATYQCTVMRSGRTVCAAHRYLIPDVSTCSFDATHATFAEQPAAPTAVSVRYKYEADATCTI